MSRSASALCALSLALAAGSCAVRAADVYREDVRKLLEAKRPILQACYEAELQTHSDAGGVVRVHFKVERETGRIVDPQIDDLQSTPNRTLRGCVLETLRDLALEPPDDRSGEATFVWEFTAARR